MVTFTEEISNGKLDFLCSGNIKTRQVKIKNSFGTINDLIFSPGRTKLKLKLSRRQMFFPEERFYGPDFHRGTLWGGFSRGSETGVCSIFFRFFFKMLRMMNISDMWMHKYFWIYWWLRWRNQQWLWWWISFLDCIIEKSALTLRPMCFNVNFRKFLWTAFFIEHPR